MGREFFLWYYLIPYLVSCTRIVLSWVDLCKLILSSSWWIIGNYYYYLTHPIYSPLLPILFFNLWIIQDRWVSYSSANFKKDQKQRADKKKTYFCDLVMFTFLHHSDPTIPHYRKPAWSFLRGAAATVDRPLLGWMGRFFFHNISHDHVAHRKSFFFFKKKKNSTEKQLTILSLSLSSNRLFFKSTFLWVLSELMSSWIGAEGFFFFFFNL